VGLWLDGRRGLPPLWHRHGFKPSEYKPTEPDPFDECAFEFERRPLVAAVQKRMREEPGATCALAHSRAVSCCACGGDIDDDDEEEEGGLACSMCGGDVCFECTEKGYTFCHYHGACHDCCGCKGKAKAARLRVQAAVQAAKESQPQTGECGICGYEAEVDGEDEELDECDSCPNCGIVICYDCSEKGRHQCTKCFRDTDEACAECCDCTRDHLAAYDGQCRRASW
jgi:hypothetical protein